MSEDKKRFVHITLPYFKQGDDMQGCLQESETVADAFLQHARLLEETANYLRQLSEHMDEVSKDELVADTHLIGVYLPEHTISYLKELELIDSDNIWEEDEEDYDEDDLED